MPFAARAVADSSPARRPRRAQLDELAAGDLLRRVLRDGAPRPEGRAGDREARTRDAAPGHQGRSARPFSSGRRRAAPRRALLPDRGGGSSRRELRDRVSGRRRTRRSGLSRCAAASACRAPTSWCTTTWPTSSCVSRRRAPSARVREQKHGAGFTHSSRSRSTSCWSRPRAGRTVVPRAEGRRSVRLRTRRRGGRGARRRGMRASRSCPGHVGARGPRVCRDSRHAPRLGVRPTVPPGTRRRAKRVARCSGNRRDRRQHHLVLLMGVARLRANLGALLGAGLDPETPAAAIRWGSGSWCAAPRRRFASQVERARCAAPVTVVVGGWCSCATRWRGSSGVRCSDGACWTDPRAGGRAVIVGARGNRRRVIGARDPARRPPSWEPVDAALARLGPNWLVLTSVNDVETLLRATRRVQPRRARLHRARSPPSDETARARAAPPARGRRARGVPRRGLLAGLARGRRAPGASCYRVPAARLRHPPDGAARRGLRGRRGHHVRDRGSRGERREASCRARRGCARRAHVPSSAPSRRASWKLPARPRGTAGRPPAHRRHARCVHRPIHSRDGEDNGLRVDVVPEVPSRHSSRGRRRAAAAKPGRESFDGRTFSPWCGGRAGCARRTGSGASSARPGSPGQLVLPLFVIPGRTGRSTFADAGRQAVVGGPGRRGGGPGVRRRRARHPVRHPQRRT